MKTIIAVANKKGGVGKSTLSTNLACYFAASDKKVLLVDADEQGSAMAFQEARPDDAISFQTVSLCTRKIFREVQSFEHDVIVIDVAAKDSPVSRAAMAAADRVIVPVQPGQYDLLAAEDTFQLIDEIAASKENFKSAVIQNMVLTNSRVKISGETEELLKEMAADYGLHLFDTKIHSRIAYKDSAAEGLSVAELKGTKYSKAQDEFKSFYEEILRWL